MKRRIIMSAPAKHLYLLDILRGVAALAVVIFHYVGFYFTAPLTLPNTFTRAQMPFYAALSVIYSDGWRAVELFFVLSGFIFFYQYGDAIRSRTVGGYEFFVLRFSRLYPLHFVTLILVAGGQLISTSIDHQPVMYACNDAKRFLLNLFFLTDWLPGNWVCWSFNGPVWSLSVEIFLYFLFFFFALLMPASWMARFASAIGLTVLGIFIYSQNKLHLFGVPLFCFYSGGTAYLLWERMHRDGWSKAIVATTALSALAGCIAFTVLHFTESALYALIFPLIVLLLALCQDWSRDLGRPIRVIGEISYSTYLIHFPVILLLLLLQKASITHLDFSKSSTWLLYLAMVVGISIPSHYLFERRAQRFLRKRLLASPRSPIGKEATV